jgi:hypothetical protein
LAAAPIYPHALGTSGPALLDWHNQHISRVVSASYSWNNLGVTALNAAGEVVTVGGRRCLRGWQFDLDVANEYGFDLDETVTLKLEIHQPAGVSLLVAYDKSDALGHELVTLPNAPEQSAHVVTLSLPRAQLADRGDYGTDLMIATQPPASSRGPAPPVTICDVLVERSYDTPAPGPYGWLDLTVAGADGKPMPARVGLYDSNGRMPIPSDEAVEIKKFDDRTRTYLMRAQTVWPANNKHIFYVDGRYRSRIAAGTYRLVASRGIEYRVVDERVTVRAGETSTKTVELQRWFDQPSRNWYSGDVHIHSPRRDAADERAMQLQAQAEDLHVANLLEMGNVATTHFPQRGWGSKDGRLVDMVYALVSGQEDPRTGHRGHTIHLNLTAPVRFPDHYLLFHKVFEAVAGQGGLSGYAHASGDGLGTLQGLALEGPFGLIDFLEVAQGGQVGSRNWFDLLNLGLRIAPAAGTDYPYLDHPGAVRNYVHVPGGYSVDGWFAALGAGRTFVTTGPLLDVTVNGKGMGDELRVKAGEPIAIEARGWMNPDLGPLDRLELIEQGAVVATKAGGPAGEETLLAHRATASRSTWFVVRAEGKKSAPQAAIAAVSAPIYVVVDGDERTWKRDAVPSIVDRLVGSLDQLAKSTLESTAENEWWESEPVWRKVWAQQFAALGQRIAAARSRLHELSVEAQAR